MGGYRRNDRLGGKDPCSSSKACSELMTHTYRESFYLPGKKQVTIATVRVGNVFGGDDWSKDRLIADCIRSFSINKTYKSSQVHGTKKG